VLHATQLIGHAARLLYLERELECLDMRISVKKIALFAHWSYWFNVSCAQITTSDGHPIP